MIDLVRELAEPSRRSILAELKTGPKTVGDLVSATILKQPNVSNHLSRLRGKGILRSSKVGRQVYYSFRDPDIARAALGLITVPPSTAKTLELGPDTTRAHSRAACQGDEAACTEIVDALIKTECGLVRIYSGLFAESLEMVGQWWAVKAIDEGQEHLASAITERLMSRIVHFSPPTAAGGHKVVLGCSEGNWHSIGIRMISDVMRLSGWKTIYLGANVPHDAFTAAVKEHRPDAVMVSCSMAETVESGLALIKELAEAARDRRMVVGAGGTGFNLRHEEVRAAGADFCCRDLTQFNEIILPMLADKQAQMAVRGAGA